MKFLPKWSTLTLALAIGTGTLSAQPADDAGDTKDAAAKESEATKRKISTQLSVEDMQVQLTSTAEKVKNEARHVMHLRELARKQKDVIKLTCVNDKLIQLKAQQNIFGAVQVQLQAALTDGQGDRVELFTQVTVGAENVRKLREEADACLGEGDLSPSESAVDVTSPDIPDDPTKSGDIFDPGVEPPGYASPYR